MSTATGTLLRKLLGLGVGTVAIAVILMWLMGVFRHPEPPGEPVDVLRRVPAGTETLVVTEIDIPVRESAVGTISPVHKVTVGSQLLARITAMKVVKAGERVEAGQVLATLDDRDLQAAVLQAQAAQEATVAHVEQARLDLKRIRMLYEKKVESKEKLDQAATALRTAEANVSRAGQAVEQVRATLKYATVLAPISGIVIDKHAEEGDLVSPGQMLVTLYDPGRMQLIARVRESLAVRLKPGEPVDVTIDSLDLECSGEIDQIVPEGEAASRAFEVKVSGPCPPGVLSGMFARLYIPLGTRKVLRVRAESIYRVGQLESVYVVLEGDRILRRFIQTGRRSDEGVEVLAGLEDGERIVADAGEITP